MITPYATRVRSPRGAWGELFIRDDTSDMSLAFGTFGNQFHEGGDEYGLRDTWIDGPFVDIGGHIGIVSLAVLLDNPTATAIIVEPFPENVAMIRQTLESNGLTDRAKVLTASVGTATIRYGSDVADRFVGNIGSHDGPTITSRLVSLDEIVELAGGHVAALKTDCEGGEWAFLRSKAREHVDLIFGEWHGTATNRKGKERLERLLGTTHELVSFTDVGGIGLFRAVRR